MNKYQEGTVFQLYEDDDRKFMVVKNVEIDDFIYLVVTPINDHNEKIKINPTGVLLLRINKDTNDISFEHDKEIIKKVVNSMFIL